MSLVAYSDSEGSEDEQIEAKSTTTKPSATPARTKFTVNKSNPRKFQVKLHDIPADGDGDVDGEPAPKRARVGDGAFSGFNAMLPAPKRDADAKTAVKPATRRVFSLKTGAEPGFSRESDAELRQLFAEQETGTQQNTSSKALEEDDTIPTIPKSTNGVGSVSAEPIVKGNAFMFKPLSVARNKKPKRRTDGPRPLPSKSADALKLTASTATTPATTDPSEPAPQPKKVSLFGMNSDPIPEDVNRPQDEEDEIVEVLDDPIADEDYSAFAPAPNASAANQAQSLDTIASDLNLSKAARRQLFGRQGHGGASAINVVNFNTDQEYAANEELRASGEQVQHNAVRGISSGKHSLKQLVSAAVGQKDALEESFATGRRNKKEAGSKYGW